MTADRTYRFATEAEAERFDRFMDDYEQGTPRGEIPQIELPANAVRIFVQVHVGNYVHQTRRTEYRGEFMCSTDEQKIDMITNAARDLVHSVPSWAYPKPHPNGLRATIMRLFGRDQAVRIVEDECASLVADLSPSSPNEQVIRSGRIHTTLTGRMAVNRFGAPRQFTPEEIEDHQAFLQDVAAKDARDRDES